MIIFILVLVNAIVALYQEKKAAETVRYLRQKLSLETRLLRDGHWRFKFPARFLVRGDVVRVRMGDIVPADIVIRMGVSKLYLVLLIHLISFLSYSRLLFPDGRIRSSKLYS